MFRLEPPVVLLSGIDPAAWRHRRGDPLQLQSHVREEPELVIRRDLERIDVNACALLQESCRA